MTPQAEVTSPMLTDSDRPKKNIIIGQSSGEEEKFGAKLASPAVHHRLPTSSTAYKGNRRVLPSCFFPNVEGIMAKLLTDWSFQEMDPYLWESTNVTKLILPWSVDKVFPYQIICMIWNIYVSRYMCIGYCHQIQCDVIMLCDNLLMITTGMEIIPLNIHIYTSTFYSFMWNMKYVHIV